MPDAPPSSAATAAGASSAAAGGSTAASSAAAGSAGGACASVSDILGSEMWYAREGSARAVVLLLSVAGGISKVGGSVCGSVFVCARWLQDSEVCFEKNEERVRALNGLGCIGCVGAGDVGGGGRKCLAGEGGGGGRV